MPEDLPPDPDELEAWERMPKNDPSKRALPPAAGGLQWAWTFVILFGLAVVIVLIVQWLS